MAASRWRDDFQLNLALDPPQPSRLREALRQFLVWTEYAFTFGAASAPDAVGAAVASLLACRAAAGAVPARLFQATRPAPVAAVAIDKDDLDLQMQCLDAANVVLVTELLPDWLAATPADTPDTLLLAETAVAVKRAGVAATDTWALDTSGAPPAPSSRARPVALAGPTLRVGPRGG